MRIKKELLKKGTEIDREKEGRRLEEVKEVRYLGYILQRNGGSAC